MKKIVSVMLASTMLLGMLGGCSSSDSGTSSGTGSSNNNTSGNSNSNQNDNGNQPGSTTIELGLSDNPTSLHVVTSFGLEDGNRQNYENAYKNFEEITGHTVTDVSEDSSDPWKLKVRTDFTSGAEPDVLFFFTGVDADSLIDGGKMVSIDEIRKEYPGYATNMKDEMLPISTADGNQYAVPVNGFWEGLFVNKTVLEDAGVEIPGKDYDWDTFIADCETIRDAGYTPIAASLAEVPHYWFEFTTLNNGNVLTHGTVPAAMSDDAAIKWVAGLEDLKYLYDQDFFPRNTITATDSEMVQLMADDQAAFLIDGSWKIGWFKENADPENFTVTYVPGKDSRAATEVIGGISMGYYITQKAWDDPVKRAAAVEFVTAMTADDVVNQFAVTSLTALNDPMTVPSDLTSLEQDAIAMKEGATFVVAPAQDNVETAKRTALFAGVKEVMEGMKTAEEVLAQSLEIS